MAEAQQEAGRVGVKRIQRLLEATMRFRLPYDAYQHEARVTLQMLGGGIKRFDLNGDYLGEDGRPKTRIFVECKHVDGAAGQSAEFDQFLARAYSATKKVSEDLRMDPEYEFMWATTCPWKGDGFRHVASEAALGKAIATHTGSEIIPAGHVPDPDLVRTMPSRIWVWVVSDRQEDMTVSAEMRGWLAERLEGSE